MELKDACGAGRKAPCGLGSDGTPGAHQRPESGEVREKNAQEKKKERLWVKCCAGSEDEGCSGGWMDWGDGWVDWRMDGGWMEG